MDLGSTNGTFVNQQRLEDARYYELHEQARPACQFSSPLLK